MAGASLGAAVFGEEPPRESKSVERLVLICGEAASGRSASTTDLCQAVH